MVSSAKFHLAREKQPMSALVVKPVSSRRERKLFLQFPWELYRGDPNWIPPLRDNQKEAVGYTRQPFYERNSVQTFLAHRGGEVCGRIAGVVNVGHIERHNDPRGFFGFFECRDDQEAANALFDAVRRWLAIQNIHCLRGPTNPSQNYELGTLIDGFDSPPTFMMTYNPPYYPRLLENYGFRKTQDLYAFWGHVSMLPKIQERFAGLVQQIIERYNVRIRPLDKSRFLEDVKAFLTIYNRSMSNTWGFVPMSAAEIEHVARGLKHLIVPELAIAVEVDDKMVGATFGLLDYNPRIRDIDGRLLPFGFIHLLRNRKKIKRIRLISTNVVPEYQLQGLGLVVLHGVVPKAIEWGLEEAEFSWVLESNSLSRGSLQKGGAKIAKTYRLYDLDQPLAERGDGKGAKEEGRRERRGKKEGKEVLEVRPVQSAKDLDQFARVPWPIYADDPQWVPPLLLEVKQFLDRRKHPFYLHGDAAQFLALRGGVPLGRILVSDDPRYNQEQQSNLGCFGMFECPDDPEMAHALLDAAAAWLRARGRTSILGPIDYSLNYNCGLLVEGFHTPPRIMSNHNRPYYARLLESWGLAKAKDLYAWWFSGSHDMVARWQERAERIRRRGKVIIRPFRTKDFDAEVERCKIVYNGAMRENWGFVSMTDAELRYMAKRLAELAIPELILLAEADGRPVGLSITLPDINEAIRPLDGRLTKYGLPINLARFLYRRRHIKTARVVLLDVLKDYRRRGIAEMLILQTLNHGKDTLGYTGAELGWTLEDNDPVNRTIEAVGGQRYKIYRVYQRDLGLGS
jgi:GNAT superfamily N-acetyltransferase